MNQSHLPHHYQNLDYYGQQASKPTFTTEELGFTDRTPSSDMGSGFAGGVRNDSSWNTGGPTPEQEAMQQELLDEPEKSFTFAELSTWSKFVGVLNTIKNFIVIITCMVILYIIFELVVFIAKLSDALDAFSNGLNGGF